MRIFNRITTIAHFIQRLVASIFSWFTTLFASPQPVPVKTVAPRPRRSVTPPPARPMLFLPLLEPSQAVQAAGTCPAINPMYLPVLVSKPQAQPVKRASSKLQRLLSG